MIQKFLKSNEKWRFLCCVMLCHAFNARESKNDSNRMYVHIAQTVFCEREVILRGIRGVVFIG